MEKMLDEARRVLASDPKFADLAVSRVGEELHLSRGDREFARLLPAEKPGEWQMEYCHNEERWGCLDFRGSLEECLEFLSEHPHFLFWEG